MHFSIMFEHLKNYGILLSDQHLATVTIQSLLQFQDQCLSSWQQQTQKTKTCFLNSYIAILKAVTFAFLFLIGIEQLISVVSITTQVVQIYTICIWKLGTNYGNCKWFMDPNNTQIHFFGIHSDPHPWVIIVTKFYQNLRI